MKITFNIFSKQKLETWKFEGRASQSLSRDPKGLSRDPNINFFCQEMNKKILKKSFGKNPIFSSFFGKNSDSTNLLEPCLERKKIFGILIKNSNRIFRDKNI